MIASNESHLLPISSELVPPTYELPLITSDHNLIPNLIPNLILNIIPNLIPNPILNLIPISCPISFPSTFPISSPISFPISLRVIRGPHLPTPLPNMSEHVRTCPTHVLTCPNMSEHVRICPNMSEHVRTCPNMSSHVRHMSDTCPTHVLTCPHTPICDFSPKRTSVTNTSETHTYSLLPRIWHLPILSRRMPSQCTHSKVQSQGSSCSSGSRTSSSKT